jgi:ferrochelatase
MREDGITHAVAFCTAAYRSEASLERYVVAVNEAREKIGSGVPLVQFVGSWFDHPRFIDAICARVAECVIPEGAAWVFTAHSIPCCLAKESTYVEELRQTASLVASQLGRKDWTLAFTSRSGNPRDPWLEPDISKVIAEVAGRGVRDLFAIPIGFVADHVEVLYDLDVEAKAAADKAGINIRRAKTVGDHPLFITMIADMVRHPDSDQRRATHSDNSHFRDGRFVSKVGSMSQTCYCFSGLENLPCRPMGGR